MTTLVIPDELDEPLTALAKIVGLPKEICALKLLEEALEDQEDFLIAVERLDRIDKGIDKAIPFAEILEKYIEQHGTSGLDDCEE